MLASTARILVVRTSAIGDVVLSTAFLGALRCTYPQAHIAWLVDPAVAPLLAHDSRLDEVISWPLSDWRKAWKTGHRWAACRSAIRFVRALRARRFDCAIDLQGLLKSGLPAWLSGAPLRVGLGSREGSQWLMTRVVPRSREIDRTAIACEYEDIARAMRLDVAGFGLRLHVSDAARGVVAALLRERGLNSPFGLDTVARYAMLVPFTTRPQKHWMDAHWRRLVPLLREQLGLRVLVVGGRREHALAEALFPQGDVVNLAGVTTLDETAALVEQAAVVIGVDSSVTHMGPALGVPSVAVFGSTHPYGEGRDPRGQVIWLGLSCSPCQRHPTCNGAYHCLRNITPEMVLERVRIALDAKANAYPPSPEERE